MNFEFPIAPKYNKTPVWTGKDFLISEQHLSIIRYTENLNGWNSNLTSFHEKEAYNGNHYIDIASRKHALSQLKNTINKANIVILEIGSSSGFFLKDIIKTAPNAFIIGSDSISEPLENIALNIPLLQFDLNKCPLPDNSIDAVVLLNVLEHIEDDKKALEQLYRILKPKGIAIIEVPANPNIYDTYDEMLKHYRRYNIKNLTTLSENVGFKTLYSSHLGFFIYPIFKLFKIINKQKKFSSNEQKQVNIKRMIDFGGKTMNYILHLVMIVELSIGNKIKYPFGIRCLLTLLK